MFLHPASCLCCRIREDLQNFTTCLGMSLSTCFFCLITIFFPYVLVSELLLSLSFGLMFFFIANP